MHSVFCSTGAFIGRLNGRDFRLLKDFYPKLECDGIELMIHASWYPEAGDLIRLCKEQHIHVPVLHCEKTLAERISRGGEEETAEAMRLFRINCEIAEQAGADRIVLHLWNGLISDSRFENNLAAFGALQKEATNHGLDLLVENVVCRKDPMTHWQELREVYPDIHFVFDTKMAAFHHQLDLLYDPEFEWLTGEGHIRHYHVNDYGGGYMDWDHLQVLRIGDGHIDFDKFFNYVRQTEYQGDFTLEGTGFDPDGTVRFDLLNEQFAKVRRIIGNPNIR